MNVDNIIYQLYSMFFVRYAIYTIVRVMLFTHRMYCSRLTRLYFINSGMKCEQLAQNIKEHVIYVFTEIPGLYRHINLNAF